MGIPTSLANIAMTISLEEALEVSLDVHVLFMTRMNGGRKLFQALGNFDGVPGAEGFVVSHTCLLCGRGCGLVELTN